MGEEKLTAAPAPVRHGLADRDPPVIWHSRGDAASRHAAISRHLFKYSNYKSWVEKMRIAWDEEEEAANGKPVRRRDSR